MSLHVAAYDVQEDRRRNRVARVLAEFGHRVQLSVFVVNVAPEDLPDLECLVSIGRTKIVGEPGTSVPGPIQLDSTVFSAEQNHPSLRDE